MVGRRRAGWLSVGLVLGWGAVAQTASAQTSDASRAAARELGAQGLAAYQSGDYAAAVAKLDKAYALVPAPSLRLWKARALERQGKLLAASEQYLAATRMEVGSGDLTLQRRAQEEAAREREALVPRIPSISVQVEGANPAEVGITLDGQALASTLVGEQVPTDPGERVLVGTRGSERVEANVRLAEGERQVVVLRFVQPSTPIAPQPVAQPEVSKSQPTPSAVTVPGVVSDKVPPSSTSRMSERPWTRNAAWIGASIGGAGLLVGATTGAIILGRKGELEDSKSCQDYRCAPGKQDDVDSFNMLRTVSSVGLIGGGVLLAAGVGLLVIPLGADAGKRTSSGLFLLPNGVGARGAF